VLKLKPIETWLNNVAYSHSQSKNTEISYRHGLRKFLNFIGKTPEQILEDYENTTDREFKRKYAKLVRDFISVQIKDFAIGSVGTFVAAIRSFFMYNDLPLGHIPVSKGNVTYHNRDITRKEITFLLDIGRPRDRAFFCLMAQTGLRPATLCKLKLKHIEPELSRKMIPCKVDIPKHIAKGKYRHYFTFMGEESAINLEKYLRKRKETKPDDYLFTKHGSNKPITPNAMSCCFKELINKLRDKGDIILERKGRKPAELRLYNLRKWFRKQAGHAGFDYVNFWMGHTLGVDDHYFSRDVKLHRKVYAEKAIPFLRLSKTTIKVEHDKEIEKLKVQMKQLQKELKMQKKVTAYAFHKYWEKKSELHELDVNIWYQDMLDEQVEMNLEIYKKEDEAESKRAEKKAWELVKEMEKKKKQKPHKPHKQSE